MKSIYSYENVLDSLIKEKNIVKSKEIMILHNKGELMDGLGFLRNLNAIDKKYIPEFRHKKLN